MGDGIKSQKLGVPFTVVCLQRKTRFWERPCGLNLSEKYVRGLCEEVGSAGGQLHVNLEAEQAASGELPAY